jgi:hypothetical protein
MSLSLPMKKEANKKRKKTKFRLAHGIWRSDDV